MQFEILIGKIFAGTKSVFVHREPIFP